MPPSFDRTQILLGHVDNRPEPLVGDTRDNRTVWIDAMRGDSTRVLLRIVRTTGEVLPNLGLGPPLRPSVARRKRAMELAMRSLRIRASQKVDLHP